MLNWLYNLLGTMLSFFNSITGSYALALLFYALVFKIVFLPFSIKQQKNQIKMAKLAPKIALIRAKYKGRTDQPTLRKQQEEIMELQQKEGYSAMSGCLPLLIQLPLIMLLYTVIQNPLSYIAKTTNAVASYNDSFNVEELPPELKDRYSNIVAEADDEIKISKDAIILELLCEFHPDLAGKKPVPPKSEDFAAEPDNTAFDKAYEDYNKALTDYNKKAEELSSGRNQIKLIGYINSFVSADNENEALDTVEERSAYVSSFGLDYASYPDFGLFGADMAKTPSFKDPSILIAIPFLTALVQWLSMFLTRKLSGSANAAMQQGGDQQTKSSMLIMDLMMPAMTLWMAFSFSAMLGLYWMYQSLLGLLQSFILSKAMPLPKFTEDEIKEMNRQQKEAEKAARAAAKNQPKYRSLHYIDDDDYEELPTLDKKDGKKQEGFSSDVPEIKD